MILNSDHMWVDVIGESNDYNQLQVWTR